MEVVLGNHERWGLVSRNEVGPGIRLHHDYSTFYLEGDEFNRKFGVIGRIDDTPKVRDLMDAGLWLGEPDKIFFERLEGQQVRDRLGFSDVLLGHDAPYPFVLGHRPVPERTDYMGAPAIKGGAEIVGSDYLNAVIRTIEPKYWFGGHMHLLDIRYIGRTRAYNLPPIDPSFQQRGYVVLNTQTMRADYYDI